MKLGPHLMSGGWPHDWLSIGVRVVKWHAQIPERAEALPTGTLTIGRPAHYMGFSPVEGLAPQIAARQYFQAVILPAMTAAPWMQAWESPNEPEWNYDWTANTKRSAMLWYAAYFAEFARLVNLHGRRAVIGNWSVGNPDFPSWQWYGAALEAVGRYDAILGRHSYGWLTDELAFRHRLDEQEFIKLGFHKTPVAITECGAEEDHGMMPWRVQYGGDFGAYFDQWIAPFVRGLDADPYVLGATLFTAGTGGEDHWFPYDVSGTPIVQRLATLKAAPPPAPPPPPQPPTLTNQRVFNVVAAYGKELNKNLIGRMSKDLVDSMAANRPAAYTGGSPLGWGLTEAEKIELARRLGL